jgi:hypothetical protein
MSDPITMEDAAIYKDFEATQGAPSFIGVFIQGGKPLPVTFWADGPDELWDQMQKWLLTERGKLAKREAHLAYLRSDEAIAARKAALAAKRAERAKA